MKDRYDQNHFIDATLNSGSGESASTGKKDVPAKTAGSLPHRNISALTAGLAIVGFGSLDVQAQVPPDAGSIQQELERAKVPLPAPAPPSAPVVEEAPSPAPTVSPDVIFTVKGFRFTRNVAFVEEELQGLLKGFVGRELSFADLEHAAQIVTLHYRDHDYLIARAYVPVQEIKDGIVEITVLEGRIESINRNLPSGVRLKDSVVEDTLRAVLPREGLIRLGELERGLLLLNDLPGVQVGSLILPGGTLGSSIVSVDVKEGPLASGILDFDNQGNKYTGTYRIGTLVNLNDPSGLGDTLSLRATASTSMNYGRVAYQLPLGASGFRVGGVYSDIYYRLCCDFESLKSKGDAQTSTLNAMYPFIRSRNVNLFGTASFDAKHYFNSTVTGTVSDKKSRAFSFGLSGNSTDYYSGSGLSNFGVNVASGHLSLDGWAEDRLADNAGARTHGRYTKTSYFVNRLQNLGETTTLFAGLTGQMASRNLDSSEKFTLGGWQGIRAYPSGEGAGDEGMMINLELRQYLMPSLQFVGFLDHGEVRVNRKEWDGWREGSTHLSNYYGLTGAGVALDWSSPGAYLVRASVAYPIGENPGRSASGNDADNTKNRLRMWFQSVMFF